MIGSDLRNMREALGLTMGEMSRITGVSTPAISRLERGDRVPNVGTLQLFSKSLPIRFVIEGGAVTIRVLRKLRKDERGGTGG